MQTPSGNITEWVCKSISLAQGYSNSSMLDIKALFQINDELQVHKKTNKQQNYHITSNISCTLEGNEIVDHSDIVGAPPDGAAPTTS